MPYRAFCLLLVLLLFGCAAEDPGPSGDTGESSAPETTAESAASGEATEGTAPEPTGGTGMEETVAEAGAREIAARELAAGSPGQGPRNPEMREAFSADALAENLGESLPDRGRGAYVAAFWGRKNTGGYNLSLAGAREAEGRIEIRLRLEEPGRDAMVTQAITYPYVVVYVPGARPEPGNITLADEGGRTLEWPVVVVGGGG